MPAVTGQSPLPGAATIQPGYSRRVTPDQPGAALPVSTAAVAIVSGWATSVVATDLIAGWWRSDRLFCIAVAFLSLVFFCATISGVILLLRRRLLGSYLIAVGAVVALLTFGSLFIAGARVPWIVHGIPVLQATSAVLALLPGTRRWLLR